MARAAEMSRTMAVDRWTGLLGGLVERHPRLWIRLGGWESALLRDDLADVVIDRPIYITGLARSGSTILLEVLARHRDTASHRYRDFPLVLTPWAWNWFVDRAGRGAQSPRERAHRDRIVITPESPEAFEEVIWMAFFPSLHDRGCGAGPDGNTSRPEFEAFYRDHIRKLIRLRGGSRYLAKGNYNVMRIAYLKRMFPDARFVVPIRDPVWHIASLMKQHRLFAAAGAEDERVRQHLRRSGHFEFGLDRHAVHAGDDAAASEIEALWREGDEVGGWAAQWALVYRHVTAMLDDPALGPSIWLVRYEDLCADPDGTLASTLAHCGLAQDGLPAGAAAGISAPGYYAPGFTEAELATIRQRTAAVAERFGYRQ